MVVTVNVPNWPVWNDAPGALVIAGASFTVRVKVCVAVPAELVALKSSV